MMNSNVDQISDDQIAELNTFGLDFYYSNSSKEYISDANGYEMGISYDPTAVHSAPFTLRIRKWDDDSCQYEDTYQLFGSFAKLKANLV